MARPSPNGGKRIGHWCDHSVTELTRWVTVPPQLVGECAVFSWHGDCLVIQHRRTHLGVAMQAFTEPTSFIIAEYGADSRAWARRLSTGTPSVVTIVQASDESMLDFAMRVRGVVSAFVRGGGRMARAVLVGGGATGSDVLSARSLALRALVSPMASQRQGTLLLDAAGPDRFSMMALASTVESQVAGSGVTVRATQRSLADVA